MSAERLVQLPKTFNQRSGTDLKNPTDFGSEQHYALFNAQSEAQMSIINSPQAVNSEQPKEGFAGQVSQVQLGQYPSQQMLLQPAISQKRMVKKPSMSKSQTIKEFILFLRDGSLSKKLSKDNLNEQSQTILEDSTDLGYLNKEALEQLQNPSDSPQKGPTGINSKEDDNSFNDSNDSKEEPSGDDISGTCSYTSYNTEKKMKQKQLQEEDITKWKKTKQFQDMPETIRQAVELSKRKQKHTEFWYKLEELNHKIKVYVDLFYNKKPKHEQNFIEKSKLKQQLLAMYQDQTALIDFQANINLSQERKDVLKRRLSIQPTRQMSQLGSEIPSPRPEEVPKKKSLSPAQQRQKQRLKLFKQQQVKKKEFSPDMANFKPQWRPGGRAKAPLKEVPTVNPDINSDLLASRSQYTYSQQQSPHGDFHIGLQKTQVSPRKDVHSKKPKVKRIPRSKSPQRVSITNRINLETIAQQQQEETQRLHHGEMTVQEVKIEETNSALDESISYEGEAMYQTAVDQREVLNISPVMDKTQQVRSSKKGKIKFDPSAEYLVIDETLERAASIASIQSSQLTEMMQARATKKKKPKKINSVRVKSKSVLMPTSSQKKQFMASPRFQNHPLHGKIIVVKSPRQSSLSKHGVNFSDQMSFRDFTTHYYDQQQQNNQVTLPPINNKRPRLGLNEISDLTDKKTMMAMVTKKRKQLKKMPGVAVVGTEWRYQVHAKSKLSINRGGRSQIGRNSHHEGQEIFSTARHSQESFSPRSSNPREANFSAMNIKSKQSPFYKAKPKRSRTNFFDHRRHTSNV